MLHADVFAGGRRTPNTPARGFLECAAPWFQHSPETYRRRFGFLKTIEKDLLMSDLPLFSSSSNLTNYRSKAPSICCMRTFSQEGGALQILRREVFWSAPPPGSNIPLRHIGGALDFLKL